jgi:lytic murein transglycosylase
VEERTRELVTANLHLEQMALTDLLTKLPNRCQGLLTMMLYFPAFQASTLRTYTDSGARRFIMHKLVTPVILAVILGLIVPGYGVGAPARFSSTKYCGNSADGFKQWRQEFKREAMRHGIKRRVLNDSLDDISYSSRVTRLDRNQKSFKLTFDEFMKKRGADYIVRKGRKLKQANAKLLKRIERKYGVPPGIIMAIWGMESAFGRYTGKMKAIRSLATLAYDCRRSTFFTRELLAALKIIQQGDMTSDQMRGAWAGEIGQTQFLASNYLKFAVDFDGDGRRDLIRSKADALASTANFLASFGWMRGRGYQKGQINYQAIEEWNSAGVYQKALAVIARRIDKK